MLRSKDQRKVGPLLLTRHIRDAKFDCDGASCEAVVHIASNEDDVVCVLGGRDLRGVGLLTMSPNFPVSLSITTRRPLSVEIDKARSQVFCF
jgi:hypothetical protein